MRQLKYSIKKIKHFIGYCESSKMVAKEFKYNEYCRNKSFLRNIKIVTKSDLEFARFEIKLYAPNEYYIPTFVLNNSNIEVNVGAGINEYDINISSQKIEFPRTNLFVAINWIKIEENISHFGYHRGNKNDRLCGSFYQPTIGTYPSEKPDTYILGDNGWESVGLRKSIFKNYNNSYHNLAIQLGLV